MFKFFHGFGLGVMRKPGGEKVDSQLLDLLFSRDEEDQKRLRQFYTHAADFMATRRQLKPAKKVAGNQGERGKTDQ